MREKLTVACKVLRFILSHRFTQFMMNILFAKTTHERFRDDLHKFSHILGLVRVVNVPSFVCTFVRMYVQINLSRETASNSDPYMFYLLLHIILYQTGAARGSKVGKTAPKIRFLNPIFTSSSDIRTQPKLSKQLCLSISKQREQHLQFITFVSPSFGGNKF